LGPAPTNISQQQVQQHTLTERTLTHSVGLTSGPTHLNRANFVRFRSRLLWVHVRSVQVGSYTWKKNYDSEIISKYIINPINNIYICGETYSLFNQAWIEGALETSDKVVKKIIN